jgi:Uncharacterised nucleotidyltransferase
MTSVVRPENQILICVARRSLDDGVTEKLRELLRPGLDWEYLVQIADRHCLIPLLYVHLSDVSTSSVPQTVMSELRSAYHESTRSNLLLTGELIKVLECFEANGIQAIPFKGPTLALRAYGDVGLRQFGDLDVLVHKQDVPRVRDLLVSPGFKPTAALTRGQQAALLRFDCACNFENRQGVMLDVHWNFVEQHFSIEMNADGLWDRLEPITIGDKRFMTLSTEDLLLILCLHGFTHLWERFGWICDIASLIDVRNDLDWQSVLQNSDRLGLRRILQLGLMLANDLLDTPIPAEVRSTIEADAVVTGLAHQIQRQLFEERSTVPGFFGGAILNLRMRERKRDRFGSCLRLMLTPRSYDWMSLSLPEWLFFLYYPLRPLRLAAKYGARLFQRPHVRGL